MMDGLRPSSNAVPDRLQEWKNRDIDRFREVIIEHLTARKDEGYPAPKAIDVAWWYSGTVKQGSYVLSHCEVSEFMYGMKELEMDAEGRYHVIGS
jgi:hypothetical protein